MKRALLPGIALAVALPLAAVVGMQAAGEGAPAREVAQGTSRETGARAREVAQGTSRETGVRAREVAQGTSRETGVRADARPQDTQERWPDNTGYDGSFKFARIWYDARGGFRRFGEPPWHHDYPFAERNLGSILSELTYVRAFREGGNVFRLGDPELFRYPVALLSEPGEWRPDDREVEALRAWLGKGGFLIFDDFVGERDLRNLIEQMRRVVPGLTPLPLAVDAPIFQTFFEIETLAMVHPYRGAPSQFYGFYVDNDPTQRMLAIANHNNDLGELWEYSAEGFFPVDVTNEAYRFGVNYVLYALTR